MGGLFGSESLELAISLSLFFLTVSLICSAVREMLEAFFKSRAGDLERALRELLGDTDGRGSLVNLMAHPLIAGLFKGRYDPSALDTPRRGLSGIIDGWSRDRNFPSYIPAGQFASAIIDLVARGPSDPMPYSAAPTANGPVDLARLRALAPGISDQVLRRAIETATDGAQTLDEVKRRIEAWFNGSMDRASGWYKRRTQWVLLVIGLLAAIALNLDSVTVARRLFEDPTVRAAALKRAESVAAMPAAEGGQPIAALRGDLASVGFPVGWDWREGWPWPMAQEELCTQGTGTPAPIRCADGRAPHGLSSADQQHIVPIGTLLLMPVGWLVTALAVTMGAPFWFDLLAKFMIVRSTVKPAQKSPEAGSPENDAAKPLSSAEDPDVATATAQGVAPAVVFAAAVPDPPYMVNRWRIGPDPDEGVL